MAIFFVMFCAAATAALLAAEAQGRAGLRAASKISAALAFLGAALAAGALDTGFGRIMFAGLVACAVGDALLLSARPAAFLGGMAAFALGHGLYAAGFVSGEVAFTGPALASAAAMAAVAAGLFAWLRPHLGAFTAPVAVYCAIISVMAATSFGYWEAGGAGGAALALAAAAFAASDIAVARDRFVRRALVNRLWGLPLYFAAQCGFALNV